MIEVVRKLHAEGKAAAAHALLRKMMINGGDAALRREIAQFIFETSMNRPALYSMALPASQRIVESSLFDRSMARRSSGLGFYETA